MTEVRRLHLPQIDAYLVEYEVGTYSRYVSTYFLHTCRVCMYVQSMFQVARQAAWCAHGWYLTLARLSRAHAMAESRYGALVTRVVNRKKYVCSCMA